MAMACRGVQLRVMKCGRAERAAGWLLESRSIAAATDTWRAAQRGFFMARIYVNDTRRLDRRHRRGARSGMSYHLSYTLRLQCGCVLYVSRHPETGIVRTRVIQSRGAQCCDGRHQVGLRLYLWEILPDRKRRLRPTWGTQSFA
jgi:hypothetical protein